MWRRGTVPLWWGQEIKNTVGEAEIYIQEDPFNGVAKYYQRLQQRYAKVPPQPAAAAAAAASAVADEAAASTSSDPTTSSPVTKPAKPECVFTMINLLRCAPGMLSPNSISRVVSTRPPQRINGGDTFVYYEFVSR